MAAAVFLAAPAIAADIPVKARPPAVVAAWSWTGCYIGAHGGWQRARVDAEYGANSLGQVPGTPLSEDLSLRGLTLGGTAGCNYQVGDWVIGVEGDYDFVTKSDTRVETAFPAFRVRVEQLGLATARGRIGYAFDRGFIIPLPTMYYVTAGGVWARMETSNFVPSSTIGVSQTENYSGWTIGYGTEYALRNGFSIKTETLYARMGRETNFAFNTPVALAEFNIRPRDIWISRIGLNYRFYSGQ